MNVYKIIKTPCLSEKTYNGIANKNYTFKVDKSATKTDVKRAVEEIFGVKVEKVNIANYDGKVKRTGLNIGRRASYKKAYVQLKEDSKSIEFFDNLA